MDILLQIFSSAFEKPKHTVQLLGRIRYTEVSDTKHMSCNVTKCTFRYVCPAKIQISLYIDAVWSESSLGTFWIATQQTHNTLFQCWFNVYFETMLNQCWFNIKTLNQHWFNFDSTLCSHWVIMQSFFVGQWRLRLIDCAGCLSFHWA